MKQNVLWLGLILLVLAACGSNTEATHDRPTITIEPTHTATHVERCKVTAADPAKLSDVIKSFKDKYGITIDYNPKFAASHKLEWENIPSNETNVLLTYLEVALNELSEYPAEFIKTANVGTMVYAYNLKHEKGDIAGLAMFEERTLVFEMDRSNCSAIFINETFHHEYFHMYQLYPTPQTFEGAEWSLLNDKSFKYTSSKNPDTSINHPERGFVSNYAKEEADEDTAETFTAMMIPLYARKLDGWIVEDDILAKKVAFLKRVLNKTSPKFNEEYWEKIRKLPH